MTLRHPWFLLLLLAVPALEWLRVRAPARLVLPFSDGAALRALPVSWAVRAHALLPWIRGAGLALLVVALARPQKGLDESVVRTEAVDIVLVVDVSPSMAAEDFSTRTERINRLDAAKRVIEAFVKRRENDRIGMVAFAAMPYTASPLTMDHAWLLTRTAGLEIGMVGDGTGIGTALASAVNRLRDSRAKSRVVVLLTDGMNNSGSISPDDAAQAAEALGIKVYTVGAGTRGFAPMPVRLPFGGVQMVRQPVEIDEALLQRMAKTTGAAYFRATDLRSLEDVYAQIDELEKTEIEVRQFTRYEERFMGWAAAGLLLLAGAKALSLTRLGRLPA
ncbi:MAG: VWA domain-containing protein [Lentisphaerae bacterium]|nr:VWA domain-containing protein [Lentisphaerota bacterium]